MNIEKVCFKNERNDNLIGYYFSPDQYENKSPILFAPSIGIKQSYYRNFCQWLCQQGHPVLSFDFNGIGESLEESPAKSTAAIRYWGEYDLPAAIDCLLEKTLAKKIILVGHGVGGQLMGLSHNYDKLSHVVGIASSAGFIGNMQGLFKWKAWFFFNIYIPLCHLFFGYTKTKVIGIGEDLPPEVAREWALYCQKDGYIASAVGKTVFINYFNHINCPFTVIYSIDDHISCKKNVESLLKTYPSTQAQMVEINPSDYGFEHIGYNAYFKEKYQKLWPVLYHYIAQNYTHYYE